MTHVQRIKPRPYRSKSSSKLRQLLARAGRRPPRHLQVKRAGMVDKSASNKMVAQYARVKPNPRGYDRWNHALLRRLQNKRFLTPTGHVKASLRQILASQGVHQMSVLERKWANCEERLNQVQMPDAEAIEFKKAFNTWYNAGCSDTRETYFWRIKYCGLIELGVEMRYIKPLLNAQQARQARGLK